VPFPVPAANDVRVVWVDVSSMTDGKAQALLDRLSDDERIRFRRFRHALASYQFLAGRLVIRQWLQAISGTAAGEWQFAEGPRGRPTIASPSSPWSFNLAHSGGMVACVLSRIEHVGVDLEHLDRRPMADELFRRYCSPDEIADIERHEGDERSQRFLMYWTLKEAYLKARGLGIAVHLADVEFSLAGADPAIGFRESLTGTDPGWAFALFQPTPRCLLSVAAPQPAGAPRPAFSVEPLALEALTG
jgi:4'-phosphopantetheinyl transferase